MPPTKSILDLKDSHQQSMLSSYFPSKRLETNDEEKENNKVKFLLEQVTPSKSNLWKFNSLLSIHVTGLSEILTLSHKILNSNNHYNEAFKNIVGKGEKAGNQYFHLYPHFFNPI